MMKTIILCSSSPARKKLLGSLGIPFNVVHPEIDESPLHGETPQELVIRLAIDKAKTHHKQFPDSLIIGSDQVAVIDNDIIGKPLTYENAVEMLERLSGREVVFFTGLCLLNTTTMRIQSTLEKYTVKYKVLSLTKIENYLKKEQPYQCAGSTKVEGLGIALMKELRGNDPSSLTGLPLIALIDMLENESYAVI